MRKILNKGHRIRASDKHLVYHFSIGTLLFVFGSGRISFAKRQRDMVCRCLVE